MGATHCGGARASHCSDFSCCGAQALGAWASVVAACGISSCGLRALQWGSVVVLQGLNCSTVCGIFPDQGQNPCLLHPRVNSYTLPTREVWKDFFFNGYVSLNDT